MISNNSIAIVTSTLYPYWYKGAPKEPLSVDKLRGDLAQETINSAQELGYQLIVVDGGSSKEFRETLSNRKLDYIFGEFDGISSARRRGLQEIRNRKFIQVICTLEPEKTSFVTNCLSHASQPLFSKTADVVVPKRSQNSFSTYPKYQAESEQAANIKYNRILREHDLLTKNDQDLDFFFGVRLFINESKILSLFMKKYQFRAKNINPEMYSDVLFFPIIAALHYGLIVKSVEIAYRHPQKQTLFEENNPQFMQKRDLQKKELTEELIYFIKKLREEDKS